MNENDIKEDASKDAANPESLNYTHPAFYEATISENNSSVTHPYHEKAEYTMTTETNEVLMGLIAGQNQRNNQVPVTTEGLGLGGNGLGLIALLALLNNKRGGLLGGDSDAGAANVLMTNADARIASLERLVEGRFNAQSQRDLESAIQGTAASTQAIVSAGNAALSVSTSKDAAALGVEVQKTAGELNTQNALNTAQITTQTAKGFGEANTQVAMVGSALGVSVEKGFGELNTQNALTSAALGVQVAKTAADNQQYLIKGQGDTNTQISTISGALGVQAEKIAAASALAAKDILIDSGSHYAGTQLTALNNTHDLSKDISTNKYDLADHINSAVGGLGGGMQAGFTAVNDKVVSNHFDLISRTDAIRADLGTRIDATYAGTQRNIDQLRFDTGMLAKETQIRDMEIERRLALDIERNRHQSERDHDRLHRHIEVKADENWKHTEHKTDEILKAIAAGRLAAVQDELNELRARGAEDRESHRRRESENIIVTNTNTAIAQQQQQQQQQQREDRLFASIQALVQENQYARATNQAFNIGNTGLSGIAGQTANPINVR